MEWSRFWTRIMMCGVAGALMVGAGGPPRPPIADGPTGSRRDGGARAGGRIEGMVVVSRALASRRPRFRIYAGAGPGSQPPVSPARDSLAELRNVIVYIDAPGLTATPSVGAKPPRAVMTQRNEEFVPHVLVVEKGTVVEFPNEDPVFHNVFSLSKVPRPFDLGRYPKGSSRAVTFDRSGVAQLFCHIHSDMSAVIVVRDNRYFAIPDSLGRYSIEGIPPGEYVVTAWHERIKPITRRVRVTEGGATRVDLSIPLPPERQD